MGPSITVTGKLWLQRMHRAQPRGLLLHREGLGWYQEPQEMLWSPLRPPFASKPAWVPSVAGHSSVGQRQAALCSHQAWGQIPVLHNDAF